MKVQRHPRFPHLSLSSWRAWIEILDEGQLAKVLGSLSSWRAWIEIPLDAYGVAQA